jgi:integrase/recombinase XerD
VSEVMRQLRLLVARCKWHSLADISAGSLLNVLGAGRKPRADGAIKGWSAQTYNHYLGAARQFTRWLVRDRRLPSDPLSDVSKLNTPADRRHDRRALTYEEFGRLTTAAKSGKAREGISGPDRAMLYVLAGWTGFRKGELGSLTKSSFRLDDTPPTVTVAAAYSKRRRQDTQILHPEVVRQLREWLASKANLAATDLLFPISARAGGLERDVCNMVQKDLAAARKAWLKEAKNEAERESREKSDFLSYRNYAGLFADFHSLRHFFITNLERSGVSPRMAQTLARHSDIRLTLGIYTHVALHDQVEAIEALPGPGVGDAGQRARAAG